MNITLLNDLRQFGKNQILRLFLLSVNGNGEINVLLYSIRYRWFVDDAVGAFPAFFQRDLDQLFDRMYERIGGDEDSVLSEAGIGGFDLVVNVTALDQIVGMGLKGTFQFIDIACLQHHRETNSSVICQLMDGDDCVFRAALSLFKQRMIRCHGGYVGDLCQFGECILVFRHGVGNKAFTDIDDIVVNSPFAAGVGMGDAFDADIGIELDECLCDTVEKYLMFDFADANDFFTGCPAALLNQFLLFVEQFWGAAVERFAGRC